MEPTNYTGQSLPFLKWDVDTWATGIPNGFCKHRPIMPPTPVMNLLLLLLLQSKTKYLQINRTRSEESTRMEEGNKASTLTKTNPRRYQPAKPLTPWSEYQGHSPPRIYCPCRHRTSREAEDERWQKSLTRSTNTIPYPDRMRTPVPTRHLTASITINPFCHCNAPTDLSPQLLLSINAQELQNNRTDAEEVTRFEIEIGHFSAEQRKSKRINLLTTRNKHYRGPQLTKKIPPEEENGCWRTGWLEWQIPDPTPTWYKQPWYYDKRQPLKLPTHWQCHSFPTDPPLWPLIPKS